MYFFISQNAVLISMENHARNRVARTVIKEFVLQTMGHASKVLN